MTSSGKLRKRTTPSAATTAKPRAQAARQDLAVYRVNARLDADAQAKLDYLARQLGSSTSDVLRDAVKHYYDSVKARSARRRSFIDSVAGTAQGPLPTDLSENHKRHVAAAIAKKHGHH
jgi:predicted transcriptional regulator